MKNYINDKYKHFLELLDFGKGKYRRTEVFKDFVVMFAIAIKNKWNYEQVDEDVYLQIVNKYDKEELDVFPKMVVELIRIYSNEKKCSDILGEIYEQIGASCKINNQFFTPIHISTMMAKSIFDKEEIKRKDFETINDPSCGSGVMFLAAANCLNDIDIDYTKKLFVVGQDVDLVCACMTYIQISLYGLPGYVIWGDTLTLKTNRIFYTPQFFIGNWYEKIEKKKQKIA